MTTNALVYARISRDVDGLGLGVGVDRQQADCLALCERNGWEVVEVLVDNDVSAFSGKRRPGYERALERIRAGEAHVLVAWHPDRLHRSPSELERFVELVETTGTQVATVTAGDVDLGNPEGRLMARITGAVARKESEDKSRRLRRKHQELAEAGKVSGGGNRPFGFQADRIRHDRREAALVREAARRVLAGESLYAIVTDWTGRGVSTVTGAKWTTTHIRSFLLAPRVAGLREHGGRYHDATWKPILDRDTWDTVRAVLAQRSRARTRPARSYVLSGGLLRCAKCGAAMVSAPRPYGRAYACLSSHGGCNGVSMKADPLEELIVGLALEALDTSRMNDKIEAQESVAESALMDLDGRLTDLAEMFAGGEISRSEWTAARAKLEERRREHEDQIASAVPNPAANFVAGKGSLRSKWPRLTVDQQRSVLAAVFESVTVASAGMAGGKVDLGRVAWRWSA